MKPLSEDQQAVYDLLSKGESIESIAQRLSRPVGIIAAQQTRIINKGYSFGSVEAPKAQSVEPSNREQPRDSQPTMQDHPTFTAPKTHDEAVGTAQESGNAKYLDDLATEFQKHVPNLDVRNVHPMVLMGTTIQFMKLCGGRFHAHQVIEDIYGALKLMVDGGNIKDMPGGTTEHGSAAGEKSEIDLEMVSRKMKELQDMIGQG
jgi:hypothetical protein